MIVEQIQLSLKGAFVKRKLDPIALNFKEVEKAGGKTLRQFITIKEGIDQDNAKKITKFFNPKSPGPVKTAIFRSMGLDSLPDEVQAEMVKKWCPLGEIAQPEEMANLASFLASDDAKNMTGSIVVSDGGMMIKIN